MEKQEEIIIVLKEMRNLIKVDFEVKDFLTFIGGCAYLDNIKENHKEIYEYFSLEDEFVRNSIDKCIRNKCFPNENNNAKISNDKGLIN